ncbi:MAG: aminoacyl-tRNA hydrolase [Tepidisphaeraceae bacterium]
MKLVVGLGNPGSQYVGTRHNIGFEVIDSLAARFGWIKRADEFDRVSRTKFSGLAIDGIVPLADGREERVLLLKPMTFMNKSGSSVSAAMNFFQMAPTDVMIVLDDLALPCGRLRIRADGSSGGHNGLRDIEAALGTTQYPRLRIGIDPPPSNVEGKQYVLERFTRSQRQAIDPAIDRAVESIAVWLEQGTQMTMNRFNADANPDQN